MDISANGGNYPQLSSLLKSGGQMAIVASGGKSSVVSKPGTLTQNDTSLLSALTGVSFTADGVPDFDALRAAGGQAHGAIPGDYQIAGWSDGEGNTATFFAASISADRKSGALVGEVNSQYVKGLALKLSSTGSEASHRAFAEKALQYLEDLSESDSTSSPNYRPRSTFDLRV